MKKYLWILAAVFTIGAMTACSVSEDLSDDKMLKDGWKIVQEYDDFIQVSKTVVSGNKKATLKIDTKPEYINEILNGSLEYQIVINGKTNSFITPNPDYQPLLHKDTRVEYSKFLTIETITSKRQNKEEHYYPETQEEDYISCIETKHYAWWGGGKYIIVKDGNLDPQLELYKKNNNVYRQEDFSDNPPGQREDVGIQYLGLGDIQFITTIHSGSGHTEECTWW